MVFQIFLWCLWWTDHPDHKVFIIFMEKVAANENRSQSRRYYQVTCIWNVQDPDLAQKRYEPMTLAGFVNTGHPSAGLYLEKNT